MPKFIVGYPWEILHRLWKMKKYKEYYKYKKELIRREEHTTREYNNMMIGY